MTATRIQYLIASGALAASAIFGALTAAAQPDDRDDPGIPMAPNDPSCQAQPGMGVCAGGPYGLDGPGMGGMGGVGGSAGMGGGFGGMFF